MDHINADRRVRRTKALLRQALIALMAEKRVQDITVTELAALADVNRGTFYGHYKDVYDMVDCLEGELMAEFTALLDAYTADDLRPGLRPILRDIFTFIGRNADVCSVFFWAQGKHDFFQRMKDAVYTKVLREWGQLYGLSQASGGDYFLSFLVAGTVGLVQTWGSKSSRETPDQMAELAERLILNGLSPYAATPPSGQATI